MKKTKTLPGKLVLTTETIRKLGEDQLLLANGGRRPEPTDISTKPTCKGC